MTPAPISVERLSPAISDYPGNHFEDAEPIMVATLDGEYVRHSDYAALLHQLAEMSADLEREQGVREDAQRQLRAAERAREELQAKLDALLEVGPILSECRWFLVDMHIWPPETTCAMSVDLLPKVDDAIIKAHAALGHPASTTSAAFLAASKQE